MRISFWNESTFLKDIETFVDAGTFLAGAIWNMCSPIQLVGIGDLAVISNDGLKLTKIAFFTKKLPSNEISIQ